MKKLNSLIGSVFLILVLQILLGFTALSQRAIEIENAEFIRSHLFINLTYHVDIKDIDGLQVYLAEGMSNNSAEFKLIADIKNSDDSIVIFPAKRLIIITIPIELQFGIYTLFIQSYKNGMINGVSNCFIFKYNKRETKTIKFITQPEQYAWIGVEYIYDADVEAEDTEEIGFELKHNDAKVEFNKVTGVLKWIPEKNGFYRFTIRAYSKKNPNNFAMMDFEVYVYQCLAPAKVTLTITDNSNQPLNSSALAQLFPTNSNFGDNRQGKLIYEAIVENGVAVFDKVDKGKYYLVVYGKEFKQIYYKDATEEIDATPIDIYCDDDIQLSMKIQLGDEMNFYTITGRVTREETGESISNAMIEFIKVDDNKKPYGKTYWAYTNPEGYYQIQIPGRMLTVMQNFICRAVEFTINGTNTPRILNTIYYNQKKDILEADLLVLPGKDTIINFIMPKPYEHRNKLSGQVIDENNQALKDIWVIAYLVDDWINDKRQKYGYTTYSDSDGKFEFTNIVPGEYILLAIDLKREYIPGYYKESEFVVTSWELATRLEIWDNANVSGKIIKMQKLQEIIGNSQYKGRIFKNRKGNLETNETIQSLEPIKGALIFAIDENDKVHKFEFSRNDGLFILDQLLAGKYKILVDKIGFAQAINSIELNSGEIKQGDIVMESKTTSITYSKDNQLIIYPQPATERINIVIGDLEGNIRVRIIDLLGNEAINKTYSQSEYKSEISFELPKLSSGIYILLIEIGSNKKFIPFIIN